MANYLAQRIIDGVLDYTIVITKRPDLKEGIDIYIIDKGMEGLIVA